MLMSDIFEANADAVPRPAAEASPPLVRMTAITKRYGPSLVLSDVRFDVRAGEVHVLAGENGAGKSTLMKILAGVVTDFDGRLEIREQTVRPQSSLEAADLGIAVIHQELSLVGAMSAADNIFLGRHPHRLGFVDRRHQRGAAARCLAQLGLTLDVDQPVEQHPIAVQQLIEIAKALSLDAKVIVMDEPTSALTAPDAERLFALIRDLRARDRGIVYISHKMDEIEALADRITVLRDGRYIGTAPASDLPVSKLIPWMVGREVAERSARTPPAATSSSRLDVTDFSVYPSGRFGRPSVRGATLSVRPGEIVGLAGLQGSGASDLLLGLFGGYGKHISGSMSLDAQPVRLTSPRQAIEAGVALLTNDRKETGLVLSLPIVANICLADMPKLAPYGWRRPAAEQRVSQEAADALRIHAASLEMLVGDLSGGNQQKVCLAKWLQTQPRLLMLDEPTRGIDVGAKQEIYELMNHWTAEGAAILLVTSEMSELLELSDRVYVMHRGEIVKELSRADATAEAVLAAAMGGSLPLTARAG
jgi:ABC-type sugar transport system ATPase subunit